MPADRVLVFTKVPEPGRVKTRLVPPLSPEEAAQVHEASLHDVVARAARERGRVEIWLAGAAAEAERLRRTFAGMPVTRQGAGDLGARLEHAFATSFADGAERVLIVGADAPTLPEETLTGAFRDLESADAVVSPSADGGYVLIGIRRGAWPAAAVVFREVPWSTDAVMTTTLRRSAEAGLDLRVLPGWYDIDRAADLARAAGDADPASHLGRWLRSEAGQRFLQQ